MASTFRGMGTIDSKVTGMGHERIETAYTEGCRDNWQLSAFGKDQRALDIAAWLCVRNVHPKTRSTVIGFECEDDADVFKSKFWGTAATPTV
jgi:hypothetical protein